MKVNNKTKNTILAENTILADTFFKRMRGLLGKKEFKKGEALILMPCNSIHTLFMRFPIDVLFVGKDHRVIKAVSSLKPFRLTRIYFNSAFTIELPAGTIRSSLTHSGDILSLE